jgi:hypothetical protein
MDKKHRRLADLEVERIRRGYESGIRGPILGKCLEELLADHDLRVRMGREWDVVFDSDRDPE